MWDNRRTLSKRLNSVREKEKKEKETRSRQSDRERRIVDTYPTHYEVRKLLDKNIDSLDKEILRAQSELVAFNGRLRTNINERHLLQDRLDYVRKKERKEKERKEKEKERKEKEKEKERKEKERKEKERKEHEMRSRESDRRRRLGGAQSSGNAGGSGQRRK